MIDGFAAPGFERVREAFARNFAEQDECGASVSVVRNGETVVDLWGGWRDAARTRPWTRDTIGAVWSAAKPVSAIAVLRLAERGLVDLEAPVAAYWPEFAAAGKAQLPLHLVLSHRAGLVAVAKPLPPGLNITDWDAMCAALAGQEPWWEPGTRFGYHVNTFGFLLGEIVRRVDGRSIGAYTRDEIAGPLAIDLHIGTGPELDDRTAEWINYQAPPGTTPQRPWLAADPATLSGVALARVLAYRNPPPLPGGGTNSRPWRAAEFPSTNGHANARALARLYGALAAGGAIDGYRLLEAATIDRLNTIEADGEDVVLGRPNRFGLGFQLTIPGVRTLGEGPRNFGHYGNGAVLGFADPDARLGFGYTCNRAGPSWRDPRNVALIEAVYASL